MSNSSRCQKAWNNVQSDNPRFELLIKLLKKPIRENDTKNIIIRRQELVNLFNSLDQETAATLFVKLKNKKDDLAVLYKCELESVFRSGLLKILHVIGKGKKSLRLPDVTVDRKIDDKGTNNNGVPLETVNGFEDKWPPPIPPFKHHPPNIRKPFFPEKTAIPTDGPNFEPVTDFVNNPNIIDKDVFGKKGLLYRARKMLDYFHKGSEFYNEIKSLLDDINNISMIIESRIGFSLKEAIFILEGGSLYVILKNGVEQRIRSYIEGKITDRVLRIHIVSRIEQKIVKMEEMLSKLQANVALIEGFMEKALEIRDKVNDINKHLSSSDGRDKVTGKFVKKKDGDAPPGSVFEKEVCRRVNLKYKYTADQVFISKWGMLKEGFPGETIKPRLGLMKYPRAIVDCIGSHSKKGKLFLYEAKESGPPTLENKGLTRAQNIVYRALPKFGGEITANRGFLKNGRRIPKGTNVKIVTPSNIDIVLTI